MSMIFDRESGNGCQGWKGAKNKRTAHQYAGIEKYEIFGDRYLKLN